MNLCSSGRQIRSAIAMLDAPAPNKKNHRFLTLNMLFPEDCNGASDPNASVVTRGLRHPGFALVILAVVPVVVVISGTHFPVNLVQYHAH